MTKTIKKTIRKKRREPNNFKKIKTINSYIAQTWLDINISLNAFKEKKYNIKLSESIVKNVIKNYNSLVRNDLQTLKDLKFYLNKLMISIDDISIQSINLIINNLFELKIHFYYLSLEFIIEILANFPKEDLELFLTKPLLFENNLELVRLFFNQNDKRMKTYEFLYLIKKYGLNLNLKKLNITTLITDKENFNDEVLKELVHSCPELKTLILMHCNEITDAGLVYLKNLRNLFSLDLTYCVKITNAGLESLKSLIVSDNSDVYEENEDHKNYATIVDEEGRINSEIHRISKLLSLDRIDKIPKIEDSLLHWNEFLQKHFIRKAGDHHVTQKLPKHHNHDLLIHSFKALGLIDETHPKEKKFDFIIVFGGTPWDSFERFSKVSSLLENEVEAGLIIYLNGERELQQLEKDWLKDKECGEIQYQHEGALAIWEKYFSYLGRLIVPFTIKPPEGRRANTADTLKEFFKKYEKGTGLFVTNGPYGPYQYETARLIANNCSTSFYFEVVSSECSHEISTSSHLDTIARRVFSIIESQAI